MFHTRKTKPLFSMDIPPHKNSWRIDTIREFAATIKPSWRTSASA
jgi:hypothetical protein